MCGIRSWNNGMRCVSYYVFIIAHITLCITNHAVLKAELIHPFQNFSIIVILITKTRNDDVLCFDPCFCSVKVVVTYRQIPWVHHCLHILLGCQSDQNVISHIACCSTWTSVGQLSTDPIWSEGKLNPTHCSLTKSLSGPESHYSWLLLSSEDVSAG